MKGIIEQLERAATRRKLVDAFLKIGRAVEVSEDFCYHVDRAVLCPSDTRALGYLMLAGLALVPEGSWWVINSGILAPGQPARALVGNDDGPRDSDSYAPIPAGAIAAAALKAR